LERTGTINKGIKRKRIDYNCNREDIMFERLKELVSEFINNLKKKEPALVPIRNQQRRFKKD